MPSGSYNLAEPQLRVGDVEARLDEAEVVVTGNYRTADRHHSPLEPSATLAWWEGDQLTAHDAAQGISVVRTVLAAAFEVPADHVHVHCPFVGGGFGCKGFVHPHQVLTAAAARVLGRAVQLVLTRAQMFTACGHQPATRQTVTLGATQDGRLTAIEHHSVNAAARADDYVEFTNSGTRSLYATPSLRVSTRIERLDRPQPNPMRAPHEGPGMFAVESAMDELAYELGMDPLELRLRNEAELDPVSGARFPPVRCGSACSRARGGSVGNAGPPSPARCPTAPTCWAGGWRWPRWTPSASPPRLGSGSSPAAAWSWRSAPRRSAPGSPPCWPSSPPRCSAWNPSPSRSGTARPRCPRPE